MPSSTPSETRCLSDRWPNRDRHADCLRELQEDQMRNWSHSTSGLIFVGTLLALAMPEAPRSERPLMPALSQYCLETPEYIDRIGQHLATVARIGPRVSPRLCAELGGCFFD